MGIHACREVLEVRSHAVEKIWIRSQWSKHADLREFQEFAVHKNIPTREVSAQALDDVAQSHQGVCVFVEERPRLDWQALEGPGEMMLVALDEIEDAHNLGAILRTSWLLDAKGILIPERRSVGLSPAVCKVACGGAEHVPVESVGHLPKALEELKEHGFWVYGLDGQSRAGVWQNEYPEECCFVIGSESHGIRKSVLNVCDELISIPQMSASASFNASVAAAIVMAEARRQKQ